MTRVWRFSSLAAGAWLLLGGCGGRPAPGGAVSEPVSQPVTLPIEVLADTGIAESAGLGGGAVVGARAWLARVSEGPAAGPDVPGASSPTPTAGSPGLNSSGSGSGPGPTTIAQPRGAAIDGSLPSAAPDTVLPEWPSPPALSIPAGLEPPVLRESAQLRIPRGRHIQTLVELEMRVDETGAVSEVRWAGGSSDTALVDAAIECARSMRFRPARRGGEAVAVWCGQRFDFR